MLQRKNIAWSIYSGVIYSDLSEFIILNFILQHLFCVTCMYYAMSKNNGVTLKNYFFMRHYCVFNDSDIKEKL